MKDMAETRHSRLETAIDGIVGSYETDAEINNLGVVALPNKRAVIEALQHLKSVLFIGFYSTRHLNKENLRYALSEHLYPAEEILVEQIDRIVQYESRIGRREAPLECWSARVVCEFFDDLPRIRAMLEGDVQAAYRGDPAAGSIEEVVFSYPSIEAISAYRLANALRRRGVPMIPRIWSEQAHAQTGIDINPGAEIGERFFIDHGTGVVIGETAVLGDDVKLYQGVTLGALSVERGDEGRQRHPTLEDGVTVYAGASIHGGETVIGAGSVIGGNVWLTRSVPPGSKIFGRARDGRASERPPGHGGGA